MKHQILMLLVGMTIILAACDKDCDTDTLAPGRYTDDCACDNGGVNFYGECLPSTAQVFTARYEGSRCSADFAVIVNREDSENCLYQKADNEPRGVLWKCGPAITPGESISSNLICPGDEELGYAVRYVYDIPEPTATTVQIRFEEYQMPQFVLLDSVTVTATLL